MTASINQFSLSSRRHFSSIMLVFLAQLIFVNVASASESFKIIQLRDNSAFIGAFEKPSGDWYPVIEYAFPYPPCIFR